MNRIYHLIYFKGYSGYFYPQLIRKLFAKTELHRAWIAGRYGIYIENGIRKSLARTNCNDIS